MKQEPKMIELVGLPPTATIYSVNICENSEDHIHDQDMAWIQLANGIHIDAGQYGTPPFFRVVVVPPDCEWEPVEESLCRTTQEVAAEFVRLANKYDDEWYATLAKRLGTPRQDDPSDLVADDSILIRKPTEATA